MFRLKVLGSAEPISFLLAPLVIQNVGQRNNVDESMKKTVILCKVCSPRLRLFCYLRMCMTRLIRYIDDAGFDKQAELILILPSLVIYTCVR